MIHATSPHLRKGCHLRPMHARHVTNPKEVSPNESECDTWISHGSMGPPERLNRLKSTCTQRTNLTARRIATRRKHTSSGAHRGLADPTGRPNRPCGLYSRASTWWLLVGPSLHPGGVCSHSMPMLRPINRRGGGSFLTNTTYYYSLTFVSKARR
jgi:hypothetical protein